MENPDEITGGKIEERLAALKKTVDRFRIVCAGTGWTIGGFGKLPSNFDQLPQDEQLKCLTKATDEFKLGSLGFEHSGNFDDGFKLS